MHNSVSHDMLIWYCMVSETYVAQHAKDVTIIDLPNKTFLEEAHSRTEIRVAAMFVAQETTRSTDIELADESCLVSLDRLMNSISQKPSPSVNEIRALHDGWQQQKWAHRFARDKDGSVDDAVKIGRERRGAAARIAVRTSPHSLTESITHSLARSLTLTHTQFLSFLSLLPVPLHLTSSHPSTQSLTH